MMSKQDIQELQQIAREEHGVELTNQQAIDEVERWLAAFKAFYKPIPQDYDPQ